MPTPDCDAEAENDHLMPRIFPIVLSLLQADDRTTNCRDNNELWNLQDFSPAPVRELPMIPIETESNNPGAFDWPSCNM